MRLKGMWEGMWGEGFAGVCDQLVPGTTPPSPPLPDSPFSAVSSFPPVSGWRQAGPPGAFKSLLGVRGREAGPSIPDRRRSPEASARNHSFSGCQPA